MKKRMIMCLLLAVVMCVGLVVPAWAVSENSPHYKYMGNVSNLSEYAKSNNVNLVIHDENGLVSEEYHSDGLCVNYTVNPETQNVQMISNSEGTKTIINTTSTDTIYTTYNSKNEIVELRSVPCQTFQLEDNSPLIDAALKTAQMVSTSDKMATNGSLSNNIATIHSDTFEDGYNLSNMVPSLWTVEAGSDYFIRKQTSMTRDQIQAYLKNRNSVLKDPIEVWAYNSNHQLYDTGRKVTPSNVIYNASKTYYINPKILLGKLQGESSLVYKTSANVNTQAFAFCMGYGATDAGDILTETGFDNQINNAARILLYYWNAAIENGKDNMPCYFEAKDGGIYLDNCGTYALYEYTPWKKSNLLLAQVFKMMFPGSGQNGVDWE